MEQHKASLSNLTEQEKMKLRQQRFKAETNVNTFESAKVT
jgi:hypothetical protein